MTTTATTATATTATANFPPQSAAEHNAAGRLFSRPLPLFGPDGSALIFQPHTMRLVMGQYGPNYSIKAPLPGGGSITRFLSGEEVAEYSALAGRFDRLSAETAGSLAGQSAGQFSTMA